jgi:murein DD-endopeptidase MepM/ murein hydrolase activator NlpD
VAIAVSAPTVEATPVVIEAPTPPTLPIASGGANKPRSRPLRNSSLHSPLPGGFVGGWLGDTGVDISARFKPVYAMAAGTLDYSENGHTLWRYGHDTPNSVRLALDVPIEWKGHRVTHVYYTHLSALENVKHEGDVSTLIHVEAGEQLGVSGVANGVPHLHMGLLLDGRVEQDSWDSLLSPPEVQTLMGNYKNGEVLP